MPFNVKITFSLIRVVLPCGPYGCCKGELSCPRPCCLGELRSRQTNSDFHLVLRKDYYREKFYFFYDVYHVPVSALNQVGARHQSRKIQPLSSWINSAKETYAIVCSRATCLCGNVDPGESGALLFKTT